MSNRLGVHRWESVDSINAVDSGSVDHQFNRRRENTGLSSKSVDDSGVACNTWRFAVGGVKLSMQNAYRKIDERT